MAAAKPDEAPWYGLRYRNRGRLDEYLGDTQPHYFEVLAVRVTGWLNGRQSLDWSYETCIVATVRELGPGLRLANFLTAFYVVVLASTVLDVPLVGQHVILRHDRDATFGNVTMNIAFCIWVLAHALLSIGFWLIRYGNRAMSAADDCTPFYRLPVRKLWEERSTHPGTLYESLSNAIMFAFYLIYFVLASLCTHTIMAHLYVERNPWFAALLLLQAVMVGVAGLDDLSQIGSPFGIQEASKTASIVLCARGLIVVPLVLIWSVGAVYAAFPPWECVECGWMAG